MPDDLEADIKHVLSQLLMAASQIAKLVAEKQREYLRDMERLTTEQARKTQALFNEGYRQAQQVYSRVARDEYWEKQGSDPFIDELTQAYGAAKTYAPFRPDAAMAARRIEDECKKRWGVEISDSLLSREERQLVQSKRVMSTKEAPLKVDISEVSAPLHLYIKAAKLMNMSAPEKIAAEAANLHAETEKATAHGETEKAYTAHVIEREEAIRASASGSAEVGREIYEDEAATAAWDSSEAREKWVQSRAGRFPVQAERGVLLADMSQGQPFRERLRKAKASAAGKSSVRNVATQSATRKSIPGMTK